MRESEPTDADCERARNWPITSMADCEALLEFVRECWWMSAGLISQSPNGELWRVSTGGYSSNEELLSAVQDNGSFWSRCWESTRRGGHFTFIVPKDGP
ncbi:MAG: hypothetical protein WBL29_17630 [Burkholderiales bacterium]